MGNVKQPSHTVFQVTVRKVVKTLKADYIGFRIPQRDKDGLAQFAYDHATTSSQVIRYLIRQLLKGAYSNGEQPVPNQGVDAAASIEPSKCCGRW